MPLKVATSDGRALVGRYVYRLALACFCAAGCWWVARPQVHSPTARALQADYEPTRGQAHEPTRGVLFLNDCHPSSPYGRPWGDGLHDDTHAIQWCIDFAFRGGMVLAFPSGDYLVSDTLNVTQAFYRDDVKDGGINIVRSRWKANVLIGVPMEASGTRQPETQVSSTSWRRPRLLLAPSSPRFQDATSPRPLLRVTMPHCYNENDNMNQALRSLHVDLGKHNPGAVGIFFHGAQGSLISDIVVDAGDGFAGFYGAVGAGSSFVNVAVFGGQYGLFAPDGTSEPCSVMVASNFSGQLNAAVYWIGQANLVLVGVQISRVADDSRPAIMTRGPRHGQLILVDSMIDCGSSRAAIAAGASLFIHDSYLHGCPYVILLANGSYKSPLPLSPSRWHFVKDLSLSVNPIHGGSSFNMDVAYLDGMRSVHRGWSVEHVMALDRAPGRQEWHDLQAKHGVNADAFPAFWQADVADAIRDCAAIGDGEHDDTAALQMCLDSYDHVFIPKGRYRISATLSMRPGTSLLGLSQTHSIILAASEGWPDDKPQPLLRTSVGSNIVAFLGLVTWWHLPKVFTLEWRSSSGTYLANYESRYGECLWLTHYYSQTQVPQCKTSTEISIPKTLIRGGGRFYNLVSDEDIAFTASSYRHALVERSPDAADGFLNLQIYALNMEHSLSEASFEVRNAANMRIDVYALKGEGSMPLVWVKDSDDFNLWGLGGGADALPVKNGTSYLPEDFQRYTPSNLRVERTSRYRLVSMANTGRGHKGGIITPSRPIPLPEDLVRLFPWSDFEVRDIISSVWLPWPGLVVPPELYAQNADCDSVHKCRVSGPFDRPMLVANGHPEYALGHSPRSRKDSGTFTQVT